MVRRVTARYSGNAFIPQSPCDVPDGSVVDLIIDGPALASPCITDAAHRAALLRRVVQRMQANPLLRSAPGRITRDELHERG
jgi:hypothetical protein